MKSTFFAIILLLATTLNVNAQAFADPATTQMELTSLGGTPLNANLLPINVPILLIVPLFNNSQATAVPAGSIMVKIGLGSKMDIDPGFSLSGSGTLSSYFNWTTSVNNGQTELRGDLIAPLPPDFVGYATFRVRPIVLLTSTILTNVLITNHNTLILLSDLDGNNNTANLEYTVVTAAGPTPVNFTKVNVLKKGCNINVNFFTENEINVDHYEIETSKNGTDFIKVGTVAAANRTSYVKDFALTADVMAATIFVRIKSVDIDGSYKYSETKAISGTCNPELIFNIYPNPVVDMTVAIKATSGVFNGKYKLVVMDMTGRLINTKEVQLNSVTQYSYDLGSIASGKYILKVSNMDGTQSGVIPFEKL